MTDGFRRTKALTTWLLMAAMLVAAVVGSLVPPAAAQEVALVDVRAVRPDGTTPLYFVRFEVTGPRGVSYGSLDTAPPTGVATFSLPVGGPYTINMILPPPCQDAAPPQIVDDLAAGQTVALEFITDVVPDCAVNPVAIWAYACTIAPPADAPYEVFIADCDTPVDRLDVYLGPVADPLARGIQTGGNGIPGRAGFAPVPSGDYQLSVERPDGIALPDGIAQCLVFDPGMPAGGQWLREFRVTGDELFALQLSLAGVRVSCDYFFLADVFIPESEARPTPTPMPTPPQVPSGTLEIHVSTCPPLYDGEEWFDDCHDAGVAGAQVELRRSGAVLATGSTSIPESPGPGVVAFPGLEARGVRIRLVTIGEDDLHVYCSAESDGSDIPVEMEGVDAIIDLPADDTTVCDLSIIPTGRATATPTAMRADTGPVTPTPTLSLEPAALTVRTGLCPDAYGGPDWADACMLGGIAALPFTLWRGDTAAAMGNAGDTGLIGFRNLPAGDYRIYQESFEGLTVSMYAVRCVDQTGERLTLEYIDPIGIALTVAAGQQIDCSWWISSTEGDSVVGVSVAATRVGGVVPTRTATETPSPAAVAGRGSIVVALYRCEGRADDTYDWYRDCEVEAQATGFVLAAADGTTTEARTADGVVRFTGLADGAYDVRLASGSWCHAEADRVDNAGKVVVLDGGSTGVYIYRCIRPATAIASPTAAIPAGRGPIAPTGPPLYRNSLLP